MRRLCIIALWLLCLTLPAAEAEQHFYALNRQNGLSDDGVLQLMQLRDGRMVIVTKSGADLYDGQQIRSIPVNDTLRMPIPAYEGATHLFADSDDRLWMKRWKQLFCFDLRTMQQRIDTTWHADDFFIDEAGETWLLRGRRLSGNTSGRTLPLPDDAGALQDVVRYGSEVCCFFDSGTLVCYGKDGRRNFRSRAYGEEEAGRYRTTSLVVTGGKKLYQVRTGGSNSILLSFDPRSRQWATLMKSGRLMHTLTLTPDGTLYLTTPDGYLKIHPEEGKTESFRRLILPDGSVLSPGINAVCLDREGGIWLGTYDKGALYTSPLSGLFDTHPIDIEVQPILTDVSLHGRPLQVGAEYDGRVLMEVTAPYADSLRFAHNQNSLSFRFSTMNYVRPRSTCYRYRFSGSDGLWHTLSADSAGGMVSDRGDFYLPLVGLPPGDYTLEVNASTNPEHWNADRVRTIHFTIEHPWWQTPWAYALYALAALLAIGAAFRLYRWHLQRKNRESILLMRIQNLVEQANRSTPSEAMVVLGSDDESHEENDADSSPQDKEFMMRATELVERHLSSPQYSVKQLAADLCMERTGLYKKLTAMMQQSPVAFIRSIRLHRAAEMLRSGGMSISDVAERTGFCSVSYFSKCFQREFGCKPSEFVGENSK